MQQRDAGATRLANASAAGHLQVHLRQVCHRAGVALLHGDGGVLSSHVSLVLEAA